MKRSISILLLLISVNVFSQTSKISIKQEGFGDNHQLRLIINGQMLEVNPTGELIYSAEMDLTKPVFGMVINSESRYSAFYVEQGATEVVVKKKGFPSSLEVVGSKSHDIYASIAHAKNDQEFLEKALANIDSPIALEVFNQKFKFTKLNTDELKHVYNSAPEKHKNLLADLSAFINTAGLKKAEVGGQIIDFKGEDQFGETFSTDQYRGKYLLLDFASTGCGPCWAGYPDMQEQTSKYDNLQVITYNQDYEVEGWNKLAEQRGIKLPWPVLWKGENKLEIFELYNVEGWPLHYLISPEGEVIEKWYGSGGDKLEKKLAAHIEKQ